MNLISFLLLNIFFVSAGEIPQVPEEIMLGDMKLKIAESTRKEIQKDVDMLRSNEKYFRVKVDRANLYFPIMEKVFEEEEVPQEIKFLAIQESALISDIVSSANAVGFWQFKDFTGKEVGLRIDKFVDERLNIVSSTHGAAKYLKRNNFYFDNWVYALTAYYAGRGGAMKYVDEKNYGAKKMTIDKDTHWYVKKFLAHYIAFKDEVNGSHSEGLKLLTYNKGSNKSLKNIAKELDVDLELLSMYNKWLKSEEIPSEKTYTVIIPMTGNVSDKVLLADVNEQINLPDSDKKKPSSPNSSISSAKSVITKVNGLKAITSGQELSLASLASKGDIKLSKFLKFNDLDKKAKIKSGQIYYLESKRHSAKVKFHTVKKGETLWQISQNYGVRLSDIKRYNRIKRKETLLEGRVLWMKYERPPSVPVEHKKLETEKKSEKIIVENASSKKNNHLIHTVVAGESLWAISKKYGISVEDIKHSNGMKDNLLQPGQKLTIPASKAVVEKKLPEETEKTVTPIEKKSLEKTVSKTYVVQPGDTLYSISREKGISVDELKKLNGKNDTLLSIGEVLKLEK